MNDKATHKSRLHKALRLATLTGIILAVPLAILIYFRLTKGTAVRDYGPVQPFVAKDANESYFDHTQLANHVTVIALFPSTCAGELATRCKQMLAATKMAGDWLESQLAAETALQASARKPSGAKAKTPVQRLAVLPSESDFSAAKAEPGLAGWRLFRNQDFTSNQIAPGDPKVTAPGFYAVDPARHFRAAFPLDAGGNPEWESMKAALSQLTMNLYFNDYLSKRTFFGPAKEKTPPQ
jgi:hypothetical protein